MSTDQVIITTLSMIFHYLSHFTQPIDNHTWVLGEFDVCKGCVSADLCLNFSAHPHSGFHVFVTVCNGRDVSDDDLGPGDILLEGYLVLLQFQSLDDGDTRLFKGCVFGVGRELEGEVVAFSPFRS